MASEADVLSVGDQVWVRTGLTGTHEEPAVVSALGAEGGLHVRYSVSRIVEAVEADRVRSFGGGGPGAGRGEGAGEGTQTGRGGRRRVRPDRFAPSPSPFRARAAPVTPSPAAAPEPVASPRFAPPLTSRVDTEVPVTPPSRKRRKVQSGARQQDEGFCRKNDDDDDDLPLVESPYFSKKAKKAGHSKEVATKKRKPVKGEGRGMKGTTSNLAKPGAAKAKGAKGKAIKAKAGGRKPPHAAKAAKRGKKSTETADRKHESPSRPAIASRPCAAGQPDGNGGLNQPIPFSVEYSKSGRATCRRCDKKIEKDAVRICHTPLFRGKPGFTVYRHLECAVFSEHVICAEDVDGYDDLSSKDFSRLAARVKESLDEIEQERQELEPDELVQKAFMGEILPPPPGLDATLLPFQIEGTSWMYSQEVKMLDIRGGILADEMGMGKTVQTISTILANRPRLQHAKPGAKHNPDSPHLASLKSEEMLWQQGYEDWQKEMKMNSVPASILPKATKNHSAGGARAGTLIVCPVIALNQWKTEIEKFCEPGALSVCIYHGPNRSIDTSREAMRKYDVILTTYQVLEADMRKMVSPNKVRCPNCGRPFKLDKLRIHLKYFCGEGAERTEAQSRTHRNRDRDGRGAGGSSRGSVSGKNGIGSRKKSEKKYFAGSKKTIKSSSVRSVPKARGSSKRKSKLRLKGDEQFDSESDFSLNEEVIIPSARKGSSRSAAKMATQALQRNRAEVDDGSEDDYFESSSSFEGEDDESSDESIARPLQRKGQKQTKSKWNDDSDSSENDELLQKAVEKQEKAKASAKKKQGKGGSGKGGSKKKSEKCGDDDILDDFGIDIKHLMEEAMAGAQMSVLHSLCFWRVVLDEAHVIKSRSSQTANAAFALSALHRWGLSGTPLQNRVGEFYSLVRFLRLDPMAYYICKRKGCECKQIHYRMVNGRCQDCGCGSIQHYCHFNRYVLNPIQRDGYKGDGRRAMFLLKKEVMDRALLRRTKETKAEDLGLPPRLVTIRPVRLHPVEEDFYNALYTQTTADFNDYVEAGTLLNNYAHIFDLLMRMRQAVDHPYLVIHSKRNEVRASSERLLVNNGTADCNLCHEPPTERIVSSCCQSAFCRSCCINYLETLGNANTPCPSCRAPFSVDLNQAAQVDCNSASTLTVEQKATSSVGMPSLRELPHVATGSILRRINLAEFATSSKIEALVQELCQMRQMSPGSKAIVFSQFVNMLDLIRWRLHSDPCLSDMGLGARALHGGMDVKARDSALKDFRTKAEIRVLLVSLKAGGVALNLTNSNYAFIMDPWWNPAAEMQAIDRTHRLGQHRPIRAVRFIAEDTVEERILQLQEKKRLVFDGTVGRDAGSLKMLSGDDMKALFS